MATMNSCAASGLLRVMTVNVHKGFTFLKRRFVLRELRDAVREVGADLVFLQEIHGARRGSAAAALDVPHYEFLADQIWPAFAYGRNAVYSDGDHGNALLSKYPIVRWENRTLSAGAQDKHERRGLLHCVLRVCERSEVVHAVCVHLGLKQAHRRSQLQQLCDFVEQHVPASEPLLVAGDFNDWRGNAHALLLERAGLDEVFVEAHGQAARTYPAWLPVLPLDRIYVRGVRDHGPLSLPARPWSGLSDHAPIAAEIRL